MDFLTLPIICFRELLYLDLALENTVRAAAERGSGASGTGAAALMAPLLQNLVLSAGDNEELAYCLKAWQALPDAVKTGRYPAKDDALKVCASLCCLHCSNCILQTRQSLHQHPSPPLAVPWPPAM